ncbi:sigma-70 family RNA polymerase sigma factor [Sorangium sp. So ce1099]|uniref:sigma-70 family RNA polymerase sigma factor n=1 Tax=Sorangium sp. So ce1099 TaxID=3133331 RepID=UPI003F5F4066
MAKLRPRPEEGQQIDPSIDSPTHPPDRFLHRRAGRSSTETRRSTRAEQEQLSEPHPAAYPSIQAILAERALIVAVLVASGVPQRDRADVEQGIIIGAWRSVERGMYRPDPADEPRKALRRWIWGIAWRKTGHYLGSAWVRRAVLHAQPLGRLHEPVGVDLHAQLQAREVLEALADLPDWQVEALLSVDAPESLVAWAKARGMHPGTAASRLRIAREALALRLRRWRR